MAESIFIRIKRLVSGSVEDLVDAMENSGAPTVMREAVRELDRILDEVKSERDQATASRLQAVRQQRMYKERLEGIAQKAQFAMDQGREDLAEAALHRQIDFEAQVRKLEEMEASFSEKERELEESVAALEMRKAHMEEELKHFEAARVEAGLDKQAAPDRGTNVARRVERAEAAYNRAMNANGGIALKVDAQNTAKVAELDIIMKKSEIETRLEALRKQKKAS